MKKILTLNLVILFIFLAYINVVSAEKVHIEYEDGGDCYIIGNWDNNYKTCNLEEDVIGHEIVIVNDNIGLSGRGYTINGTGSSIGILLNNVDNISISNIYITGYDIGIYLNKSHNCDMGELSLADNINGLGYGIYLKESDYNKVIFAVLSNHQRSIYIYDSRHNIILHCLL